MAIHIRKTISILLAVLFAVNLGTAFAGDSGAAEPPPMDGLKLLDSGIFHAKIDAGLEAELKGGLDNQFPIEIERYPRFAQASSSGESQGSNGNSSGGDEPEDDTGTDPRGFRSKFTPYYRYVELKNGLTANLLTLAGMVRFSSKLAVTYEIPVAKGLDITDTALFQSGLAGTLPPGGGPDTPANGILLPGGGDGSVTGLGDTIMRIFYKPDWMKGLLNSSWMIGAEVTVPTATNDLLGAGALIVSPVLTWIIETPFHGLIAGMNFYDFDAFKDNSRASVSRYRGRWFIMQPLSRPGPGVFDGIYLLPEFQPVYDFETDEFSFWAGPEFGKILSAGNVVYVKPGWGVDAEAGEREFTFEVGWRWFF